MRINRRRPLIEFGKRFPDAVTPLAAWYKVARAARWKHFGELRAAYPAADMVGKLTVFNIKGNSYRLIVKVDFTSHIVFVRWVLTHAEYDTGQWKKDPWF